jgi:hypothetical protein
VGREMLVARAELRAENGRCGARSGHPASPVWARDLPCAAGRLGRSAHRPRTLSGQVPEWTIRGSGPRGGR